MAMRDSDWKHLFRLMGLVLALPGDREDQRQAVEEALERLEPDSNEKEGRKPFKVFDLFCALNLDGADEVIGDEEYEGWKRERVDGPTILKMRKRARQEKNGQHGRSLLD